MPLSDPTDGQLDERDRVRVLMLNVYGQSANWDDRRSVLVAGLREIQADLVVFEEAIKTDAYDQVVDLLGAGYHVAHQTGRQENGSGLSIASRWRMTGVRQVDLRSTPRVTAEFPCAALLADVEVPSSIGALVFVGIRTSWQLNYARERELEAVAVARVVEEVVGERELHVVLTGDFNAGPDAASVRFWAGRQSLDGLSVCYRNAWESAHPGEPGHTFTGRNPLVAEANWDWPFQQIDHVFVRCGEHGGPTLAIAACQLAFDEPVGGVWASDHVGVVADLAVPAQRRTASS